MTITPKAPRKLSMKQRYSALTRDLDWDPSYVTHDEMFPYTSFEGITIHDWSKWEDPFRLTVDAYTKYQAEKDKRLYAVLDGFAQSQGHLGLTDASYLNAMKLFLQGVTPLEYQAHRHFAYLSRHLDGPGPRFASLCQSLDEIRHAQTEIHTLSNYNKYYTGFHSYLHQHDRVWYLSVPKSFFDDAVSAGPFEFLIAIGFSFEYLLTNLLFVPFMSGASFNGDLPTMTFGFSAQSDESRHMTLGLEAIKFLLEQDEANVPIVQHWINKWFWRGYRVTALVAQMLDYMLPRKVMSWKEAFELYFEQQMLGGLFQDLAFYGITPPQHVEQAIEEKEILSHQVYWTLYQFSHAAAFTTSMPTDEHLAWLSETYPDTFDKYFAPLWQKEKRNLAAGGRHFARGLPELCQVCQVPMLFTDRATRRRSANGRATSTGSTTTSAPTAASTSSTTSPRSSGRHGCRFTRSTRATAGERASPTSWAGTRCVPRTAGSTRDRSTTRTGRPGTRWPSRPEATDMAATTMGVKAIGTYDFPSRSRQELYGDDQLVHLWWKDNPWFCAAACFRSPKAMSWGDFWNALAVPFLEEDPDFDPNHPFVFAIEGRPFTPDPTASLESQGITHKCVISMSSN